MTEVILGVLLLASNGLWAFLCIRLMDRLMSRNFAEYAQVKQSFKKKIEQKGPDELVIDPIDEMQAQEMNSMMGIV